jgi:ATP-dependent RNA helicase DDX1
MRSIPTDGIHYNDRNGPKSEEGLSEGVKILKIDYLVKAISAHKMDQAIIFCRTKLDCDNVEKYLIALGGSNKFVNEYSCVCLHSDRRPQERKDNLTAFKTGDVRFLICTDVAARGIDVKGIPYVVNLTLPDDKQNYIHRIGRVGRADRMGLAISLVSTVNEKVWYHVCPSRGKKCKNTQLTDRGGCAIWYDEFQYLREIEEHLGVTIPIVDVSFNVPMDEYDGKITYGEKKRGSGLAYESHTDLLAPSVNELAKLEHASQSFFLKLHKSNNSGHYW